MSGKFKVKATLETKTAGRVAATGIVSGAKLVARKAFSLGKGIVNTLGVKTTILTTAAALTLGSYQFVPGADVFLERAANFVKLPVLPTITGLFGKLPELTFDFSRARAPGEITPATGLYARLPEPVQEFLRDHVNNTTANNVASAGLLYGAGSLAVKGYRAYAGTDVYKETKGEVKKDAKHDKKVAEKLAEIQASKAGGGPGLSNDAEFMKTAIYLDLSLFKQLDPQLANSDQFLKDLAEGATAASVSHENKRALVKHILENQSILNGPVPVQTKRELLESLGGVCPELLPLIVAKYSSSIRGDREALTALLRLAQPAPKARKEEVVEAGKVQVATVKAILKTADSNILDRAFFLELGAISREAMKQVLFPLLDEDDGIAHDHLNYMLARAEKDPRGTFNEAQFLQNTPAFMAVVCAADPTMLASASEALLKTPAFLADLFDRNPQAVKEVLKTPLFKEILAKNNRKIPTNLLKKILIFSHDARFVDCIPGALPKLSESLLVSLAAKTPSLLKTKLLLNRGLPAKQDFVKSVLRKNPWVLKELPRSVKTKKLLEELVAETRPFSNIRRLEKGRMLKHNELISAMTMDPDCAALVQPGGVLAGKTDFEISKRAKTAIVSHKGSFESRERSYLDILEFVPEFITKIPVPSSEEEWERFVIKAVGVNPKVIEHLPQALDAKLSETSSAFLAAKYKIRTAASEEVLETLRAQAQGGTGATAALFTDKNFIAECAKSDRKALRTLLGDEERVDAKFLRELDHKHNLGKGVYTYGASSVDKRGAWIVRTPFVRIKDSVRAKWKELVTNRFDHGPIDYLRYRVEDYSGVSRKKFSRFDTVA